MTEITATSPQTRSCYVIQCGSVFYIGFGCVEPQIGMNFDLEEGHIMHISDVFNPMSGALAISTNVIASMAKAENAVNHLKVDAWWDADPKVLDNFLKNIRASKAGIHIAPAGIHKM